MTDQTKPNRNLDGSLSTRVYPDQDLITKVLATPFDDAVGELENFLQDKRYSAEHKQKTLATMIDERYDSIEADVKYSIGQLEKEVLKLREQQRISITPPAEEVAQIAYVKDALTARWKTLESHAIATGWKEALASKDKVALRVYADFAESEMQTRKSPHGFVSIPHSVPELRNQTDDILYPGTRQARERADRLETTLPIIKQGLERRLNEFRSIRFSGQGEYVNPHREAMQRMLRG